MNKKLLALLGIVLLALIINLLFWKMTILASSIFLALAYIKHQFYPIKNEFLWFLFISLGFSIAEILILNIGGGWTYTQPQIYGIPIWLPFFWGLIGTSILSIYENFKK
jgi:hypothetical protein